MNIVLHGEISMDFREIGKMGNRRVNVRRDPVDVVYGLPMNEE